jgi:hypothetical protein
MKSLKILALTCCTILTTSVLTAQAPAAKPAPKSPAAQATVAIDGKNITIDYSSPRVNGRAGKIFTKDGLIAKGDASTYPAWRAGANNATSFKTETELKFGELSVPAGSYTLWVDISDADKWVLIINKQTGQWGREYHNDQDLGRVPMKMTKPADLVENLTYTLEAKGKKGKLTLAWENHSASVAFKVK